MDRNYTYGHGADYDFQYDDEMFPPPTIKIYETQFEKYINHIREHIELIAELNEACRKREENNTSFGYSILTDDIIEMLEIIFKDKFQWIEYWAYELNFGKFDTNTTIVSSTLQHLIVTLH